MMNHFEEKVTIEDIVESFAARLESGERPSIGEYKARYPQLADRIEAVLPALVVLENVESDPGDRKLAVDDSIPEVLGDYQIVQEVGRGGMGIVFEAKHTTMRRRVALKVLPKSSAEKPNYLKRFLTEARSAGQLHHTNIVPVFEVGESDGLHYYSMQFIHGDNLDHVIDDIRKLRQDCIDDGSLRSPGYQRPSPTKHHSKRSQSIAMELIQGESQYQSTPPVEIASYSTTLPRPVPVGPSLERKESKTTAFTSPSGSTNQKMRNQYHHRVASVGVQVAEALSHAHENGVLHRDVKPANLILDTDGNVWMTDFGLAKLETHDLTQTGDIIGTLRYMAPERFSGEADPRSDIYSLGLTLYELATLKCAFENDRGTLFQDVANSSSVISPRKIDETIPQDLETIIIKAIEPQPERRYQSAEELAEDLKLFLSDRPIKARRSTWVEKGWRICRRNPIASSLAACLVVLLVVVTAGSIQLAITEARDRKQTQKNLFFAKLDQAKMRRYSGRPGQRFEAMGAIQDAVSLLPHMDFTEDQIRDTEYVLRSEVIAASSLTDVNLEWSHIGETGWANRKRFAFDINGKYFAEGHDEGKIRIRKIKDKEVVLELPGGRDKDPPWMMHFSPDSRYLIAKYHQPNVHNEFLTVVWDLEKKGSKSYVTRFTNEFCFSKDSQLLAVTYEDRAEIVSLEDGRTLKTIYPEFSHHGEAAEIQFNSDSTEIAISCLSTGIVEFWDIKRVPTLHQIVECENAVFCMDWDSHRQIFVVGAHHGTLHYWIGDLVGEPNVIPLHQNTIHEIHLHLDRELVATTAWDGTTRFTDLTAGKEVLAMEDHELACNGFCPDGRLGLFAPDRQVGIWDVALPMIQVYSDPQEKEGFACCIHPRFDNIVARTVGDDIEFWNIADRKRVLTLEDSKTMYIAFSHTGEFLYTSGVNGLQRWQASCDGKSLELTNALQLMDSPTKGFDVSRNGNLIVVASNNLLRLIDASSGELIRDFNEQHRNLTLTRFTDDGRFVLSGTWKGKGIKIWDLATGDCIQTVLEDYNSISPVPHPTDPSRFFVGRFQNSEFSIESSKQRAYAKFKQKLKYDGNMDLIMGGQQMLIRKNAFTSVLLDTDTQQELATFVSAGQSRIVDQSTSLDGSKIIFACFDSLQVMDLQQVKLKLQQLGIDW